MSVLNCLLQRLVILGLGIFSVWLIVFVVFDFADRRLPWILAVGLTYAIAAYVILPGSFAWGSSSSTGSGCPASQPQATDCRAIPSTWRSSERCTASRGVCALGWSEADRLGLASSWRMIRAFVFNAPYPTAPFSTLYLFGRGQDVGFQKAIDNSPRKRHHIRFWALSLARAEETWAGVPHSG